MIKKLTLKINGMHCTSCSINIDGELEDTEGVLEARTNYARAQTEVMFNPQKASISKLLAAVARAGYTATPL